MQGRGARTVAFVGGIARRSPTGTVHVLSPGRIAPNYVPSALAIYTPSEKRGGEGIFFRGIAITAVLSASYFVGEGGPSECKDAERKNTRFLEEYKSRLDRLCTLSDVFDEYASVTVGSDSGEDSKGWLSKRNGTESDVGRRMTCADFLRAMLCYRYVTVEPQKLRRHCGQYTNPLIGDSHGLVSFPEFCFLASLVSIPGDLFDVAFSAVDDDGSGRVERDELERLAKRLTGMVRRGGKGADWQEESGGHGYLFSAWFRDEEGGQGGGGGSVLREEFASFVQDLRRDVRAVECSLYTMDGPDKEGTGEAKNASSGIGTKTSGTGWLDWVRSQVRFSQGDRSANNSLEREGGKSTGVESMSWGWQGRGGQEGQTLSMSDLALTLVSSSDPKDLPRLLVRVQALKKNRKEVPLKDALLLHKVLDEHTEDLSHALGLYCKASAGGVISQEDFHRAARVVSGANLSKDCIDVVFGVFGEGGVGGDESLRHKQLMATTVDRFRRRLGRHPLSPGIERFVACTKGTLE